MTQALGHGSVGKHEQSFTQLLASRGAGYDVAKLAVLAAAMAGIADNLSDGGDPEENLYVPAGYTYFGQFIDHDLTFDTTSTLSMDAASLADPDKGPTNVRSPRFDLDCVYANGPSDAPYLYAGADGVSRGIPIYAGASLLLGGDGATVTLDGNSINNVWDLLRGPNGRALIGDKRNDENSIVNQIQQLFILFHNKVVFTLASRTPALLDDRNALFEAARDQVRWAYQKIILEDFLPRIVQGRVLDQFRQAYAAGGDKAYLLYKPTDKMRANVPREFVAAAYRYGHSGVRQGYRLNAKAIRSIFMADLADGPAKIDSLVGFEPLPRAHVIDDWARFFPLTTPAPGERRLSNDDPSVDIVQPDPSVPDANGKFPGDPAVRLQYAYKLDPSLVEPLISLPAAIAAVGDVQPPSLRPARPAGPSLALLNLLRGNRYLIQGGQAFEPIVGNHLDRERYLRVRKLSAHQAGDSNRYTFVHIRDLEDRNGVPLGDVFTNDTPLWFYILAEAQKPIVDLWYAGAQADLSEDQLKGLDSDGKAFGPVDPPNPEATRKQLDAARAGGTQLGDVGGRIVAEVFHGLLDSDSDSLVNRAPGGIAGWDPIWTPLLGRGAATIARLILFTATPENGLKISAA